MSRCVKPPPPPAEDLVAEGVAGNGVRWVIYDTYCKNFGPKEKEEVDKRLWDIIIRSEERKLLERMKKMKAQLLREEPPDVVGRLPGEQPEVEISDMLWGRES